METQTLNMTKGERVDLTKGNPGLKVVKVGLGWDVNAGNGDAFDLDAFAIPLTSGKLADIRKIVYFNNLTGPGIGHSGDNLTGVGDGDDETITVKLAEVEANVDEIVIAINIFDAVNRKQNFGMVNKAFIRLYNGENPTEELKKFDLSEDYSAFNAMLMGKLYKKDGEWKFQAIGEGKNGNINALADLFK